ncbi:serine hydrolase [Terrabacter aerolatus]|uniref:Serine hydrolase n=1 Tax=Terrabacter aerolatus TaxID=422442 RepID=A0A512D5Y5_9MICO|nr:serine hydrolase [Terrabacter aerolatus]GEO31882.1 serine hydrolase [Terrabacter aerolatus]
MELDLPDAGGVTWSVCVRDGSGMPLAAAGADVPLRTASVGKVLLLVETARLIAAGELSPDEPLTRSVDLWVGDSGLWHTLSVETLPLIDVAALVGAVSDNLATNVLLQRVGLAEVAARATALGLRATALHDRVRDVRGVEHPPTLSTGTAAELSQLMSRLADDTAAGPDADRLVRQWLSANVDQSMVGSALVEQGGLDPIAHHSSLDLPTTFWNKTGTDAGVRADVGAVTREGRTVTWAAIANWEPSPGTTLDHLTVWAVLRGMHHLGEQVLAQL